MIINQNILNTVDPVRATSKKMRDHMSIHKQQLHDVLQHGVLRKVMYQWSDTPGLSRDRKQHETLNYWCTN